MARKRRKTSGDWNLSLQFENIANEVLEASDEALDTGIEKALEAAAEDLKQTSPSESGEYAKTWTFKRTGKLAGIVFNDGHAQLTHLLEDGHAIVNQFGKYPGRVRARKHIKPARDRAQENFVRTVMNELDKKL